MTISKQAFNIILSFVVLTLFSACTSTKKDPEKKEKQATTMRFHLQTNPDGTTHNFPVLVYRANPVRLHVERDPVLDEALMSKAEVVDVDQHGGYAIKITFDPTGTQRLQHVTTANKGRRLVVFAAWTETRWLAAPLITRNITDGIFIFTPDASREEADRIVYGLNNVIKKVKKPYVF